MYNVLSFRGGQTLVKQHAEYPFFSNDNNNAKQICGEKD